MDKTNMGPAALKTRILQMALGTRERQEKDPLNYSSLPLQTLKEIPRGGWGSQGYKGKQKTKGVHILRTSEIKGLHFTFVQ